MDSVVVTGEAVALPFRAVITASAACKPPKLVGLLANSNSPSRAYAEWTARACAAVGITYELREIGGAGSGEAGQGEVEDAILAANADDTVNGIMVYVRLFELLLRLPC